MKDIEKRVIEIIAKTINVSPDTIKPDHLIEDVCENSLDLVNVLFDLEDEFDLSIPDEAKQSQTVQDIVKGIEKLIAEEKQPAEVE